ncbi:hypothetical protein EDB19DRAFT_763001 [Suillus lakei]|nr:hypothetical protein EDB19DRAFT_763001 [Suillus lakei]
MLNDDNSVHQGRACAALPALCEVETLRNKLLQEGLIHRIVDLCQTAVENKLIAMRTLSFLAQRFDETSRILSQRSDFIKEILGMLKEKSAIVVVAALKILAAVASKRKIPEDTLSGIKGRELVKRLKTLIQRRDFFVTPAAVAALCEICHYEQLRVEAIRRGILVTLIDLFKFDKQGLSGGPRGLIKLAEFGSYRKLSKKTLLTG